MASIDIRDASLVDFLPESIASDEDIIAMSLALDPELRAIGAAVIEANILPRIDQLSEPVLDELAWAFRLDELQLWDDATVAGKRALLQGIFAIRKKSGTRYAVRRIFGLLSVVGKLIEWFEETPPAPAYTYRIRLVILGDPGITLHTLQQVPELTHRFAPTRCQLRELAVEADESAPLDLYPALTIGRHVTIGFGP